MFPSLVKPDLATVAVNALHDSVIWTYLSTGPEATLHTDERKLAYTLIDERERIKVLLYGNPVTKNGESGAAGVADADAAARLAAIRAQLADLMKAWTVTGYKYTGQVYREIGMCGMTWCLSGA